jgi:hypothetical protein
MSIRWTRTPGRWFATGTALILLGGCSAHTLDPAKDRPCAFFTKDELTKYELTVRVDEATQCVFLQPLGTQHVLTGVTVEYRDGAVADVAKDLGLSPVTGKQAKSTRVRFQGSTSTKSSTEGTCRMAAPIDDSHTLLVVFDTDTVGITYSTTPVDDPCGLLEPFGYKEVLDKLRS